jgi:glycosyltransferase involved in cell wall biosynthesis
VWKTCPTVLTYHRALDKSVRHWIAAGELSGSAADYGLPSGIARLPQRLRHDTFRQLYLQRADRIVTVSEFAKWELVSLLGVPETKVDTIPLAPDDRFLLTIDSRTLEYVRTKYALPSRYFLYVGGFEPWKNVAGLVRAFAMARQSGVRHALVLAGDSGDRAVSTLADSLGLRQGVDILFLKRATTDLPALYRMATAFISLSWGESFSLPIVEAMACGIPVVASRNGAIPDVLGDAGVQVDPRDPRQAADAMRSIVDDGAWREELRMRSARRATAFSWRRTAELTAAIYQRAVR